MNKGALIILLVLVVLSACQRPLRQGSGGVQKDDQGQGRASAGIKLIREVGYGDHPSQKMDICMPNASIGELPAVVLIHGGGWRTGSKESLMDECRAFASAGFAAATIGYRLAPEHKWPAQIEDVQLAVRFLRANSAKYGIDPKRIASMGGSAGGHLASMAGLMDTIDADARYPLVSSRTDCVIDRSGPTNLTKAYYYAKDNPDPRSELGLDIFNDLFGRATPESDPALFISASPVYLVSSDSPPFYMEHSRNDLLVPVEQAFDLEKKLKAFGIDVELVVYDAPGPGHGFPRLSDKEKQDMLKSEIGFLKRCM